MKQDAKNGMKRASWNVDSNIVFEIINGAGMRINTARCECEELIDKGVCDKVFIRNPSNCEWECYKSYDFSEYLDYKNWKCKKRSADKLVDECTENIEETRLVKINSTECKHNSCTLYTVLFSILSFTST